jgi:hypothetical protein
MPATAPSFQHSTIGWQMDQLKQRGSEWLEWHTARDFPNLPFDAELPPWLPRLVFGLLLATALLWSSWMVYRGLDPYLRARRARRVTAASQQLQAQDRWPVSVWLERVQVLSRQGNYAEACRALYMALLQQLHDRNLIPHQASRTDGEYRHQLQQLSQPQPYQVVLNTHERLCFGDRPISAADFQQCNQAFRDLEGQ